MLHNTPSLKSLKPSSQTEWFIFARLHRCLHIWGWMQLPLAHSCLATEYAEGSCLGRLIPRGIAYIYTWFEGHPCHCLAFVLLLLLINLFCIFLSPRFVFLAHLPKSMHYRRGI
ncbi:hypothetical protein BDV24DRAFT_133966 [Aspergillus arachidicola]|uniref:Uncharacterized protein n=1 Tax=Aspergillus arachidicola TaxID=656916 RepID=A0A5N6Y456_9EURO|nr:hypothetical protein BDV24DRAFT_133966 [Aspergillus arachidicola]